MKASLLAKKLKGRFLGDDEDVFFIEPIFKAKKSHLSFMLWPTDIKWAKKSNSILITTPRLAADFLDELDTSVIVIEDIFKAFCEIKNLQKTGDLFSLKEDKIIHETAIIHESAIINKAIVGPNVVIGANSVIGSDAFVPFGDLELKNLPALGHVVIEEGVRIGALCSIQLGLINNTVIKKNCLIDDQVHIGHDCEILENVIIASQTALAGFVQIGKFANIGGQVGIAPHIKVGDYAQVSGKSGVHKNIKDYEIVSGSPSLPHLDYLKIEAIKKRWIKK